MNKSPLLKLHDFYCFEIKNQTLRHTHVIVDKLLKLKWSLSKYTHFSVITQLKHERQISTKLIGENMFYMKAHQLYIVLSSKSRLVQLRIYTCYTKTCFFLGVTCYFSRITYFWSIVLFRCNDFIRSLYYF
jgi:hypothetical protein